MNPERFEREQIMNRLAGGMIVMSRGLLGLSGVTRRAAQALEVLAEQWSREDGPTGPTTPPPGPDYQPPPRPADPPID